MVEEEYQKEIKHIRKMGSSFYVALPQQFIKEQGLAHGDYLGFRWFNDKLEAKALKKKESTTIHLSEETHQRLVDVGRKDETFEDIIRRLLDEHKTKQEK